MSGIDAPQPWHAIDPKQGPPPNGTRAACPLCGCQPGEPHTLVTTVPVQMPAKTCGCDPCRCGEALD